MKIEAVKEIRARLERLDSQYDDLLALNQELLDTDPLLPRTSFDPATDTITLEGATKTFIIKFKRADLNAPIQLAGSASTAGYPADDREADNHRATLKGHMERLLEDFYHSAHRVQKLLQDVTGRRKTKGTKVVIVRNKLIEHPNPGDFYSFGYSSRGPTVRPIGPVGRQWVDEGLIPNVGDFVRHMLALLK